MTRRKPITRRQFLAFTGTAGAGALLVACGGAPDPAGTTAAPATSAPAAAATAVTSAGAAATEPALAASTTTAPAGAAAPAQALKTVTFWGNHPTVWETRSPEHPTVVNATRILSKRFEEENPGVKVTWADFEFTGDDDAYTAWLTARIGSGDAPDLVWPQHDIPIQRGWCVPLEDYLDKPNPYAPTYATWNDIFYPSIMKSLVYTDGHTYSAPISTPYPGIEVGLAYNQEWLDKVSMQSPSTWSEEVELSRKLKEMGNGLAPWPVEAQSGNVWPLALQILPAMLQDLAPELDLNQDFQITADEGLVGFQKGLIGPMTPIYQDAWREMKKLAGYWVDGWATADLDQLWREGKIGLRTTHSGEFSEFANDPNLTFKRGFLPQPIVTSKDIPGAKDPDQYTPGDGKVPADLVVQVNGADTAILKSSTEAHRNFDETLKLLQFFTTPENSAFIANENQGRIPAAKDAPIGPIWQEIASFRLPLRTYTIAWWGEGFFFDATQFNNFRKVFVAWLTGQIDDKTFFERQQQETSEGAARYEAQQKELKN